jgi:hypothetical protein
LEEISPIIGGSGEFVELLDILDELYDTEDSELAYLTDDFVRIIL